MFNEIRKHSKKHNKIRKHGKKDNIRSLHGALRNLLNKEKLPRHTTKSKSPNNNRDDIIYIRSKENILIPKLSDDEVMQRHKKADENMKNVWSNIIQKYEQMDDSKGDLIDLHTGEIIEDNGHVRDLAQLGFLEQSNTTYKSTFNDIFPEQPEEEEIIKTPKVQGDNGADAVDDNDDGEYLRESNEAEANSVWADVESDDNHSDTSSSDFVQEEEEDDDDKIPSP
ncbi:hypothetical protein C6P45_001351 [Maudiozyma exigua]|uniref:Protein SCM3 n=1 Tax=Maudiozyma exigua TaxID=34358 RepID=A0A9P6WDA6_MAUEX|nr:hypothetical protein C6P45_001351 [Kazachstania exigua]